MTTGYNQTTGWMTKELDFDSHVGIRYFSFLNSVQTSGDLHWLLPSGY
jgi:hypothetical protein